MKKFIQIVWGYRDKKTGLVVLGHDSKPITNPTKRETQGLCGKNYKPVKLITKEE
jgi:hypothetical protein